mmetsp:Transcript_2837/g.4618  ORF Transcript_2837/g.4618 Transcript_2837/m.4618 type:complete len:132 (-) Transcript_2837:1877-2272(-)
MPVTLTYFPVPGRGFPIRVCLGAAGVEYEDKHINYQQLVDGRGPEGASDEYPLGSVPVLKLESGVTYCQSGALLRYAGKKCGMYPKDDDDLCLAIDEVRCHMACHVQLEGLQPVARDMPVALSSDRVFPGC